MTLLLIIFGLTGGCLLSVLVGLLGSRRHIGFGWAFLCSALLTPLVGLCITLLSDPLPDTHDSRWGCLGTLFALLTVAVVLAFLLLFIQVV